MKATIKRIAKKDIATKSGKKFSKFVVEADVVVNENGEIRTYRSEMSMDYAKAYFEYCGVSSKDLVGRHCDVTLRKRAFTTADGQERYVTEIKYLNLLDAEGKSIIMPSAKTTTDTDFGF